MKKNDIVKLAICTVFLSVAVILFFIEMFAWSISFCSLAYAIGKSPAKRFSKYIESCE